MIIYQQMQPIAEDARRLVFAGHFELTATKTATFDWLGEQIHMELVVDRTWGNFYACHLRLGKRRVMRFYREASNGTFPVTVVMKEVG